MEISNNANKDILPTSGVMYAVEGEIDNSDGKLSLEAIHFTSGRVSSELPFQGRKRSSDTDFVPPEHLVGVIEGPVDTAKYQLVRCADQRLQFTYNEICTVKPHHIAYFHLRNAPIQETFMEDTKNFIFAVKDPQNENYYKISDDVLAAIYLGNGNLTRTFYFYLEQQNRSRLSIHDKNWVNKNVTHVPKIPPAVLRRCLENKLLEKEIDALRVSLTNSFSDVEYVKKHLNHAEVIWLLNGLNIHGTVLHPETPKKRKEIEFEISDREKLKKLCKGSEEIESLFDRLESMYILISAGS